MPRGPKGEKRPGDVIGTAVMVGRIATGEEALSRKGGRARAAKLSPSRRVEIAKKA